jgi:MFS family permease
VVRRRFHLLLREFRGYPSQFWVLVGIIFVYVAAAGLAFPYEGIYLHNVLGVSMTLVGVVFGLVPATMIPLQIWGGHLTDRFGRRSMLIVAVCAGVVWFVGFAYVREVWQVAILVAVESSVGWPLFQTASNAMIADLLPQQRRAEGFSISRVAMNFGVVIGPIAAGLALGWGVSFRALFLAAATGCAIMAVVTIIGVRESRPSSAVTREAHVDAAGRSGYRIVLADRRFLLFCAVAVLPVFCIGNFGSIYSVYITGYLGVPYGTWALLLALNALFIGVVQYPLVRSLRRRNRMVLLAVSSGLLGAGIGGSAFAMSLGSLVLLVIVMSLGEALLSPVASAEVSDFAPEEVRGRYMGVWTVVWSGGAALGPAFGGWAMDAIGGREAFFVLLLVGLAGAALFLTLAPSWRRRHEGGLSQDG